MEFHPTQEILIKHIKFCLSFHHKFEDNKEFRRNLKNKDKKEQILWISWIEKTSHSRVVVLLCFG